MTAAVREAARDALLRLAQSTDPDDPDEHLVMAAAYADPTLSPDQLAVRWADLVHAVHVHERLAAGVTDWTSVDPELVGPGRDDAARLIAEDLVFDALDELVGVR